MRGRAKKVQEDASPAKPGRLDAAGLQELLAEKIVSKPAAAPEADALLPERRRRGAWAPNPSFTRRAVKFGLAAAVLVGLSFAPMRRLFQTSSVEAVVNAPIVSVRAPIDGVVGSGKSAVSIGGVVDYGQPLLVVSNLRADSGRFDDVKRAIGRLEDERPTLVFRIEAARKALAEVKEQVDAFNAGRRRELDAKYDEYTANMAAARARMLQAEDTARRFAALVDKKYVSQLEFMQAETNAAVAKAAVAVTAHQLESVVVERDAVVKGNYVGDAYNDRPSSVQRAEELAQRIVDLEGELAAYDAQAARLANEASAQAARFSANAEAPVTAPTRGRVFEIIATPGEEVHRGQDLVRLIDCSKTLVTATVSETVYNRLHLGGKARFRLANEREDRDGAIVNLTGSAGTVAASMAVQPSGVVKENYRVTVAVPGLGEASSCNIGRTGRVVFEDAAGW